MDRSTISLILQELNLHEGSIANIYHHGSWVYGTNTPESDRDLIIVTRSHKQNPLKFYKDFDYDHELELHRLWHEYDICIYSVKEFEILLEKNYLPVLQCLFLSDEFKLKEEIDFKKIYLEKYYNPSLLKQVAFYAMETSLNLYEHRNCSNHPEYSSRSTETTESQKNYIFKNLFHGIRFLDFAEQLVQTRSVYDYKRVTHLFDQMKEIRGDVSDDSGLERVADFIWKKSAEYKSKFNALIPENIVKGIFKVHITFDCTHNTEQITDKLKKACRNTKYRMIFIEWITSEDKENVQQLMVASNYDGEYPSIVKQVEEDAYAHFKGFNIIRFKIKSLISNEGVPQSDLGKQLFWDDETNYFEFRYKILLKKDPEEEDDPEEEESEEEKTSRLRDICQSYNEDLPKPHLSHKVVLEKHIRDLHFMITKCSFDVGRGNAFVKSDEFAKYLIENEFPPLKVIPEFIVYDTNVKLDQIREK